MLCHLVVQIRSDPEYISAEFVSKQCKRSREQMYITEFLAYNIRFF